LIIFLIVGTIGFLLGVSMVLFPKPFAEHASKQAAKVLLVPRRLAYPVWLMIVIGTCITLISAYFVVASLLKLLS